MGRVITFWIIAFIVIPSPCEAETTSPSEPAETSSPTRELAIASPETPTDIQLKTSAEKGLSPTLVVAGDESTRFGIAERMGRHNVSAVSVAVARDGEVAWVEGYGEGIDPNTLFQAASLSKAVAATGIVALAINEGIDLDEDVAPMLMDFDISAINPKGVTVTLRKLLSHTAGATVHGFPGYPTTVVLPTNLEVILGSEHTNTDPVVIAPDPDSAFRYSGGGFQIAQAVAEGVSGQPFAPLMDALILAPVGMTKSTFAQPLPAARHAEVARAHHGSGTPVEGGWHVYPEQSAAGLWTTPTDYIRFVLALSQAAQGDRNVGIDPEVARAVTTPVTDQYGLGIRILSENGEFRLRHDGANEGYRCTFAAYPSRGDAIVVMTNSDNGALVASEILRDVAAAYGWPSN